MKTRSTLLILALLLCLLLAACASQPATIDQIPVYPGAQPLEPKDHGLANKVLEAMKTSAEEQALSARFALYNLPENTTWEEIITFYQSELASTDWTPTPELGSESDVFKGAGWSRTSGSTEQSLVVNFVPRVLAASPFLLVGLLTK